MVRKRLRAGMPVPAFFLRAAAPFVVAVFLLAPSLASAIPHDEDPFPDPHEAKAVKEVSPGEKLIAATKKAMEEDPEYPATSEAVEFALWCYAESGDAKDLARAEAIVKRMPEGTGRNGGERLLSTVRVAQARGARVDLSNADFGRNSSARAQAAVLLAAQSGNGKDRKAAMAAAGAVMSGVPARVDGNSAAAGLYGLVVDYLRTGMLALDLSGSYAIRNSLVSRARDTKNILFKDVGTSLRAARVMWQVGYAAGDTALQGAATSRTSYLIAHLGTDKLDHVPAAALAAACMERHPVQMVLLGDPTDPTLTALRDACVALFEPRKIIISLDPARDAERIEALMYPADMAPALFVCVESVCSAPITDPDKVAGTVRDILAASQSQ